MQENEVIEGLKLFVPGTEVKSLLEKKAAHHRRRAADYQKTYDTLVSVLGPINEEDLPKMSSMGADDRSKSKEGIQRHTTNAIEDEFLAAHIVVERPYLLETTDLHRLGVLKIRY
jgi:hypothetical protein